jgi:hypothetical protein
VSVLATSREGLRVADEQLWAVPSLDLKDGIESSAAALFVERNRGGEANIREAEAAIDRMAAAPAGDGLVFREIMLLRLRALVARVHGADKEYRDYRDSYRAMATSLGFEGHMKWAEEMP